MKECGSQRAEPSGDKSDEGPAPPLAGDLEELLREIGRPADFTAECQFQALVRRLTSVGDCGEARQLRAAEACDPEADDRRESDSNQLGSGARWDDYQLLEELGRGGMGIVYRARQIHLDRVVALKTIRAGALADPEQLDRFRAEAAVAARLDHPAIVPVFAVGEVDGRPFYAMPLVNGRSLAQLLADGPLAPRQAAELLLQVADAVSHAHRQGVIHRDLKPGNILLVEQPAGAAGPRFVARVTDFGLAKLVQGDNQLTCTGQLLGTPSYMAPEQASASRDVGEAADIYALGATLYSAVAGRPPFQAATTMETLRQVVEREPVPAGQLNPAVDRDLETICHKSLRKVPEQRYASVGDLAADLRRYLQGQPIKARPIGGPERIWRWCRRRPAVAVSLAGLTLILTSLLVLALVSAQLNVARARAAILEKEAELRDQQLRTANQRVESERRLAATQQYYALVSRVREHSFERQAGWATLSLRDVQQAAALEVEVADRLQLRNLAANCLTQVDVRQLASIAAPLGYDTHLLAFHPGGHQMAVAMLKGRLQLCVLVCDVPTGKVLHDLRAPVGGFLQLDGIRHVAWLSGGDELCITTRSGRLHRWDLNTSPPTLRSVPLPRPEMKPLVIDAPRNRIFFGSGGKLYEWSDLSSSEVRQLGEGTFERLAISPDGRKLATWRPSVCQIIDATTGETFEVELGFRHELAFSPDGRWLAAAADELKLLDLSLRRWQRSFADPQLGCLHEDFVSTVGFSPQGAIVWTSGHDQRFKLWDPLTGRLLLSVMLPGAGEVRTTISHDGRHVAATGRDRATLFELLGTDVMEGLAISARPPQAFDVSSNPFRLACASAGRGTPEMQVSFWDPHTCLPLHSWDARGAQVISHAVAVSPGADFVVVANHASSRILAWRVPQRLAASAAAGFTDSPDSAPVLLGALRGPRPGPVAIARDGSRFWAVLDGLELVSWSLPDLAESPQRWNNRTVGELVGVGTVTDLAVAGSWLLAGTKSRTVYVLDNRTNQLLRAVPVGGPVSSVALDDDARQSVCGTDNGELIQFDAASGNILVRQAAHGDSVTALDFAPDGRLLAAGSRDKTVSLWQPRGGGLARVLALRMSGSVQQVGFTPDGQGLFVLVAGEHGVRRVRLDRLRQALADRGLGW
ncbi:MAG: protein kinase [Pirellulaceae bacterium]|nr:protein kinase [Pirellulaceae bacterium]